MNDVVMDWSFALAEFLVSTLFTLGATLAILHIADAFLVGYCIVVAWRDSSESYLILC